LRTRHGAAFALITAIHAAILALNYRLRNVRTSESCQWFDFCSLRGNGLLLPNTEQGSYFETILSDILQFSKKPNKQENPEKPAG
jgi:hypothetical protein